MSTAQQKRKTQDWAQPLEKEALSERAYRDLRGAIMRAKLKPGERLRLRPIAAKFGISPTPMREALMRLVGEKALVLDERNTAVVPRLTEQELIEIRNIRVTLEGEAAKSAAQLATPGEIVALERLNEDFLKEYNAKNYELASHLNTDFHLALCRMGQLPVTYDIVESLWVRCGPLLTFLYDIDFSELDWDQHPHEKIILALKEKRPEAAKEAISADIIQGAKALIAHVKAAE